MLIQRILQAEVTEEGERRRWIVLAYTSRNEFVTWCYREDTKYDGGNYFVSFLDAFKDFQKRADSYYINYVIEHCARQVGPVEIVWEKLDDEPVKVKNAGLNADHVLDKASKMSKVELFLRELQATDTDDYNVIRDRVAAIVEELEMKAAELTIMDVYELCAQIDEDIAKRHGNGSHQSWDGYEIPAECKGQECGKCSLDYATRKSIGCTVPVG